MMSGGDRLSDIFSYLTASIVSTTVAECARRFEQISKTQSAETLAEKAAQIREEIVAECDIALDATNLASPTGHVHNQRMKLDIADIFNQLVGVIGERLTPVIKRELRHEMNAEMQIALHHMQKDFKRKYEQDYKKMLFGETEDSGADDDADNDMFNNAVDSDEPVGVDSILKNLEQLDAASGTDDNRATTDAVEEMLKNNPIYAKTVGHLNQIHATRELAKQNMLDEDDTEELEDADEFYTAMQKIRYG